MQEDLNMQEDVSKPGILSKILNDKNMLKKILITFAVVIVSKVMVFIPLPGINMEVFLSFLKRITSMQGGSSFSFLGSFGGGIMRRLSIAALGLMPYLSSCIIIQILAILIPFFKRCYADGFEARKALVKYSYYMTLTISAIQAFYLSMWLENLKDPYGLVINPGWVFRISTVLCLVASVFLFLFLAGLINKHGIGNGIAVLVVSHIVLSAMPQVIQLLSMPHYRFIVTIEQKMLLLVIFVFSVVILWYVTRLTRKVPVGYKDSDVKASITLRFSWVGRVPIAFAQSVILFPAALTNFMPALARFPGVGLFLNMGLVYYIILAVLIIFFTYFYTAVVRDPRNIVALINKHDSHIENTNGKDPLGFLDSVMTRNAIITALILIAVCLLPSIYLKIFSIPNYFGSFMTGASLLLIIGLIYDLKSQIDSYFERKEDPSVDKWELAYVAYDEIEAEIKKGLLCTHDIRCVIEPVRFTWGMPIRTAVDEYRLYISDKDRQKAKDLLK